MQGEEVTEVDVGFVEEYNFSSPNPGANLLGPFGIVVPGGINDRKPWQKAVQIAWVRGLFGAG